MGMIKGLEMLLHKHLAPKESWNVSTTNLSVVSGDVTGVQWVE